MSNAYKYNSFSFKGTAITGVLDVQENDTVEEITKHRADTSLVTEAVFLDGAGAQIVLTTTDLSVRATWALGANGAIIAVSQQRAMGSGAVASANKTRTYSNAVLVAMAEGSPYQGRGTLVMTFEAVDPAGASYVTHT